MTLARLIEGLLGTDLSVAVKAYDGTSLGPHAAPATVVVHSPDALTRILHAPGELGFARAYVAGDIDVDGDIFAALALRDALPVIRLTPSQWLDAVRLVGQAAFRRLPAPPQEARLRGRRHTKERDRAAVAYHYDVSNEFYRLILGPSMTYSCAVWTDPRNSLEDAQTNKHDLISRKLALQAGQRLLDVGCGWGGMLRHAASRYRVEAVGVTLSTRQQEWGAKMLAEDGLSSKAQIRLQDYRDVTDGPYDCISSIGMFEHVGLSRLHEYFERLYMLLRPGGRVLNHGISRQPVPTGVGQRPWPAPVSRLQTPVSRLQKMVRPDHERSRFQPYGFIDRYVFPDGELHEVGTVVSVMQEVGFEVRHVEGLREHYALTLRAWVDNLEANWDQAVECAGEARARVWRLYMAASALNFESGRTAIHQVLGVKGDGGHSGLPLRPAF